ncbi:MAG: S-adenosyl-l-methionine hydroxide adenosyltransferase family protein [bacterium]
MASSIITLLTDFGQRDGFVGTMKGVILNTYPDAKIVDISHDIEPQNLAAGAFVINTCYKYFPTGTVHVVVIDPGVGSKRRIICVAASGHFFLAPDNGVLKYIYDECPETQVVEVTNRKLVLSQISHTFHGRDIFAPVAAHLAKGLDLKELGASIHDYDKGRLPVLEEAVDRIKGEIIYIDRFGNLISNIPADELDKYRDKPIRIKIKKWILCPWYVQGTNCFNW